MNPCCFAQVEFHGVQGSLDRQRMKALLGEGRRGSPAPAPRPLPASAESISFSPVEKVALAQFAGQSAAGDATAETRIDQRLVQRRGRRADQHVVE